MSEKTLSVQCECGRDLTAVEAGAACPDCGRTRVSPAAHPGAETTVLGAIGRASSPGGAPDRPSLAGRCLDHFRLLDELGRGGVGTVYRAVDTSLEREVAVKVLNEEGESWALEAFVHEARAQARVNHPGIATIHSIGRHGEIPYFAMEYVPGERLETRVNRGPLPPGEVIRIGLQAVKALREANRQGITHRDIKPGNFLRTPAGQIKLTDFGLSKSDRGGLHLTGTHMIVGTWVLEDRPCA